MVQQMLYDPSHDGVNGGFLAGMIDDCGNNVAMAAQGETWI
jgi:hypothetical protein